MKITIKEKKKEQKKRHKGQDLEGLQLGTWGRMMVLVGGGYRHSDRQGLGDGSWFWWAWG